MCGIAGYFLTKPIIHQQFIHLLLEPIRQRGPDDEGVYLANRQARCGTHFRTRLTQVSLSPTLPLIEAQSVVDEHHVCLIHTRYSIIDPSPRGHQPFSSEDGSVIAVFNGEIYNYVELRSELTAFGVNCRTLTDTEVIVEGYRVWQDNLWSRLNGFWAVVLYDRNRDLLIVSRDRLGVAPLYYRETADSIYYASSIRSLVNVSSIKTTVETNRLLGFIETGIKDLDNSTFYREIKSFPAGTVASFSQGITQLQTAKCYCFWQLPKTRLNEKDFSFNEAVELYRNLFFNAVEIRLRADVKLAFELSGGLDSSSIVAAAALLKNQKIISYTIKVPEYDEEPYARTILQKYSIDYRVLEESEETFIRNLEFFTRMMEEPYHSPNIYTHYQMRCLMKEDGISVVLAGAGGDEVLAGYENLFRRRALEELWRTGYPLQALDYSIVLARRLVTRKRIEQAIQAGYCRTSKYLGLLLQPGLKSNSQQVFTQPFMADAIEYQNQYSSLSFHEQVLYHFQVAMLPYYLRSNDHFTMAIPLEHRFPFLDYRMVELGLQLPAAYLFKHGWTKYILRKAMEPYLPTKILWRKDKMGFPFPYERFLSRHRAYFEPFLNSLKETKLLNPDTINFDELLVNNPLQLWRMCSVAFWLIWEGSSCQNLNSLG